MKRYLKRLVTGVILLAVCLLALLIILGLTYTKASTSKPSELSTKAHHKAQSGTKDIAPLDLGDWWEDFWDGGSDEPN